MTGSIGSPGKQLEVTEEGSSRTEEDEEEVELKIEGLPRSGVSKL